MPLKFTNFKFVLCIYNLMSLDKAKKLLLPASCSGTAKPLQCKCELFVTMCITVLRGSRGKGLGWRGQTQRDPCLLFKPRKSSFQWYYQKEKSPIRKLFWGGLFLLIIYEKLGNFSLCFYDFSDV